MPKEIKLTSSQIKKAGLILRAQKGPSPGLSAACALAGAWRALHLKPLLSLEQAIAKIMEGDGRFSDALLAKRLKRLPAIRQKLQRFSHMDLSAMQDIGGMRIILKDTDEVYALKELLTGASIEDFKLRKVVDYIKSPKEDGYRSLHLVFACNKGAGGIASFNLELQLRTRLQHDWSTALETAGSVFKMNLKGAEGSAAFKRYFKLSSALLALKEQAAVPKEFEDRDRTQLCSGLFDLEKDLGLGLALERLKIREAGGFDKPEGSGYFLLKLAREGADGAWVSCRPFKPEEAALALDEYQRLEQNLPQDDSVNAVLIGVHKASLIKEAYPNYFWDASSFMARLEAIRDEA